MLTQDGIQAYLLCYPNRERAPSEVPRFRLGMHPVRSHVGAEDRPGAEALPGVQESILESASKAAGERLMDEGTEALPAGRSGRELENFWNAKLVETLHKVHQPTAGFERHYTVRKGAKDVASKPDVTITNGYVHVISGKYGERKETEAYASADEYKELLGPNLAREGKELGEVFALTYPSSKKELFRLHVLPRPGRPTEISLPLKTIFEVAGAINSAIDGFIHQLLKEQEPITEEAPRWIQAASRDLSTTLRGVDLSKLEALFGGHDFFQSLILPKLTGRQREQALRQGAAYLFFNQLLFYVLISRAAQAEGGRWAKRYPPIKPEDYSSPIALHEKYFERVHDVNYEPIYGFDVAQFFLGRYAGDACKRDVRAILGLVPKLDVPDLMGQVFQRLIPLKEIRKPLGANYTNPRAAALLARLAVRTAKDSVIDPACGSGTLLAAAYQRKAALAGTVDSTALHRQFVEHDITGIDAMAFSAHLAAVNLALQQPLTKTKHVRIGIADSTTKGPGMTITSTEVNLPREFKQARLSDIFDGSQLKRSKRPRLVSLGKHAPAPIPLREVELVMMNPPFTSWDHMGESYRKALRSAYESTYGDVLFWKTSQQTFFLLLTDRFLKPGGRVAAVLPLTTFTGRAFQELVRFFVTRYTIRAIIVGLGRSAFSEDTSLTECLFVAEKRPPPSKNQFSLVATEKAPDQWTDAQIELMAEAFESGTSIDGVCRVMRIDQEALLPERETLSGLMSGLQVGFSKATESLSVVLRASSKPLVSWGELRTRKKLKVNRWVLGSEHLDFYGSKALLACRSENRALRATDILVYRGEADGQVCLGRRDVRKDYQFPGSTIRSAVRRFSGLTSLNIDEETDFVVAQTSPALSDVMADIYGPKEAVVRLTRIQKTTKKLKGGQWLYRVEQGSTRLAWGRRFDLGGPGTAVLAVWTPHPFFLACDGFMVKGLTPREEKFVALWMNSTLFLGQLLAKQFTATRGTWMKLEKGAVDRILFPDIDTLGEDDWKRVETAFDVACKVSWPKLLDQLDGTGPRAKVDQFLLGLLGGDPARTTALQSGTLEVLESLQSAMKGD
jgi:hypothetical protein